MINLADLKFIESKKERKAFYASDFSKPNLDLYFDFKGEKPTNPPEWHDTLKWGAGQGVEAKMLEVLKSNGIVAEDYDQRVNGGVNIKYKDIEIHGYMDAWDKIDDCPIEIKSINNKNQFDIDKYYEGNPRENYVGQLGIYMFGKDKLRGQLFASSIDGLHRFVFPVVRDGMMVKGGNVVIDLEKELDRWNNLWLNNIQKDIMPDIWEYRYKYDVNTLDWSTVSKAKISKARNNQAVIGDWQVAWSPYKDLIVKLQGTTLGYTEEELAIIKEKTKGYSAR